MRHSSQPLSRAVWARARFETASAGDRKALAVFFEFRPAVLARAAGVGLSAALLDMPPLVDQSTKPTPSNTAKPTDFRCMVLPPKWASATSSIEAGILMRCTGYPCKINFSMGATGLPTRCAITTPFGVKVGQTPTARGELLLNDCDTSAMRSLCECFARSLAHTFSCLAVANNQRTRLTGVRLFAA